jgi:hypothetical protein
MSKVITLPEYFEEQKTLADGTIAPSIFTKNPWRGTVSIYENLFISQVEAVEAALLDRVEVDNENKVRLTHLDKPKLPALIACVEKWNLEGFPEAVTKDNFPLTPRRPAHLLVEYIFDEIRVIYNGEITVPNE